MTKIQPDRRTLCAMGTVVATAMVLDKSPLEGALASDKQEEVTMEKVYSMYWKHDGENAPDVRPIDGDFDKVFPTGYGFTQEKQDALSSAIRLEDRTYVDKISTYQGVPVDMTHLPTKALFKSNGYELPDIMRSSSWFIVSGKFRQVIEELEPEKHQFSAVELVDEAGMHVAESFWFNPCARVDSMDREHTTFELRKGRSWQRQVPGGKFVASLTQIQGNHIWIDPLITAFNFPFVTEILKQAMDAACVAGIGYHVIEAV